MLCGGSGSGDDGGIHAHTHIHKMPNAKRQTHRPDGAHGEEELDEGLIGDRGHPALELVHVRLRVV